MTSPDPFAANSFVWPLTVLVFALFILRKVEAEVKPIVTGMVSGLAAKSARNSEFWFLGCIMALAASCQSIGEVAADLGWVYVVAGAKVMQAPLVTIIALMTKLPSQSAQTNPPFPVPTKP